MLFLLVVFGFVCLVHTTSTPTCRFIHADRDNDAGAVLRRSRWNCPCGVAQRLGHLRQGTACRSSAESCMIYTLHRRGAPSYRGDQDEKHPEEVEPARHRARPAALGMSHHGQRGVGSPVGRTRKEKGVHSAVRRFILGLDPGST